MSNRKSNRDNSNRKSNKESAQKRSSRDTSAEASSQPGGRKKRSPGKSTGKSTDKNGAPPQDSAEKATKSPRRSKKRPSNRSAQTPSPKRETPRSGAGGKQNGKPSAPKGEKAPAKESRGAGDRERERSPRPSSRVEGSLMVNARGFGFVENPEGADLFIPLDNMGTGMDGDTVLAEIVRDVKGKKPVGKVLKVTKPSVKDLVGVFHREDGKGSGPKKIGARVIPDDERFKRPIEIPEQKITPKEGERAPREGEFVLVRRERWEDPRENPRGRIVEIIGSPDDPDIDTLIIAKGKGLRTEFPAGVMEEAEKLSLPNMRKEKKRREDLRNTLCFTIDPESAKDYDDAVSLEQLEDGTYELGVHIADVSYYVPEGSALDKEALERGTSVYFVNSVLPMLPEKLSNDLCSLRPDEDRLAFSVLMRLDSRGVIRDYRITESIIRSKRRFTYREVEDIIEGAKDPYAGTVHQMMMLSLVLRRAREEKGSIDFDVPVPVISLDEHGIPYEVRPSERIDANRMIEEFMLAANLTVARHIAGESATGAESPAPGDPEAAPARQGKSEKWPFIYRIHEKPDENEVREFLDLLGRLGINYRVPGDLEPEDYRKILDIIENLEFKDFAEKVALRSMTKAVYSTDNIGHFGLAFDAYTHFTSPIRRYPDLIVHRLLKRYAAKGAKPPARGTKAQLQKICEQCTEREIQAVEAEREHSKIKAMEFLAEKVGETYDGIIAGITSFGFFVELNHYLIEGLVHVSELRDDRYEFDKDNYTLTGERTGKAYRLGDPVRVTIKKVSVEERKADFILAEER